MHSAASVCEHLIDHHSPVTDNLAIRYEDLLCDEGLNCFYAAPLISLLIIYVVNVCRGLTSRVQHKIAITEMTSFEQSTCHVEIRHYQANFCRPILCGSFKRNC